MCFRKWNTSTVRKKITSECPTLFSCVLFNRIHSIWKGKIFRLQSSCGILSIVNNIHFYLWDELFWKSSGETKMPTKWTTERQQSCFKCQKKKSYDLTLLSLYLFYIILATGYVWLNVEIFTASSILKVNYMKVCEALEDRKKISTYFTYAETGDSSVENCLCISCIHLLFFHSFYK